MMHLKTVPTVSRRSRLRLLVVVLFAIFLAAQGALSFVTKPEPYPSIRMPGFGTSPSSDGLFSTSQTLITIRYDDGTATTPAIEELMHGVRFSVAGPAFNHVFPAAGSGQISDAVRVWLREKAFELGDGAQPMTLEICRISAHVNVQTGQIVDQTPCANTKVAL
ncbi:hypothetical protein [Herbiconiux sp. UC225_62]|uniref:hypothetical protein n=1 Tax=Herbiconiux sp. UC225_62 TaxID=3350168 RepID=UPI0036D3DC73